MVAKSLLIGIVVLHYDRGDTNIRSPAVGLIKVNLWFQTGPYETNPLALDKQMWPLTEIQKKNNLPYTTFFIHTMYLDV